MLQRQQEGKRQRQARLQALRERLPETRREFETAKRSGDWRRANEILSVFDSLGERVPDEDRRLVAEGVQRLRQDEVAARRKERIAAFEKEIKTLKQGAGACLDVKNVTRLYRELVAIVKEVPDYRKARRSTRRLEKCRRTFAKTLKRTTHKYMIAQRKSVAKRLETLYLDQGMDTRVRVTGKNQDVLRINYIFAGRVMAHKITEGGSMRKGSFLKNLEDIGFRRVVFYDTHSESYYYRLKPMSIDEAAQKTLKSEGVDRAFRVPKAVATK